MSYVTPDEIREHLYIQEGLETDDFLQAEIDAAEAIIEKYINCDFSDLATDGTLPKPIIQAIKILVGNLYNNRESVSYATNYKIPFTFEYLLQPYKNYERSTEDTE